ncbi:MAG: 50S ribosomal protein L28 [Cyclobacteriaceae bacterium]|jgi:large subunit ribosomal protein L28
MSKICQITGKKVISGHNVSHSNNKTKRKFHVNLQDKKFLNPETGKWINLRISAAGIRTVNKIGLPEALKRATEKGYYKA